MAYISLTGIMPKLHMVVSKAVDLDLFMALSGIFASTIYSVIINKTKFAYYMAQWMEDPDLSVFYKDVISSTLHVAKVSYFARTASIAFCGILVFGLLAFFNTASRKVTKSDKDKKNK